MASIDQKIKNYFNRYAKQHNGFAPDQITINLLEYHELLRAQAIVASQYPYNWSNCCTQPVAMYYEGVRVLVGQDSDISPTDGLKELQKVYRGERT